MSTTQEGARADGQESSDRRRMPAKYVIGGSLASIATAFVVQHLQTPYHGEGCYQTFSLGSTNVTYNRKITLPDNSHDELLVFVGERGTGVGVKAQGAGGTELQSAHLDAEPAAAASTAMTIGKYAITFKLDGDEVVADCQPAPLSVTTHS